MTMNNLDFNLFLIENEKKNVNNKNPSMILLKLLYIFQVSYTNSGKPEPEHKCRNPVLVDPDPNCILKLWFCLYQPELQCKNYSSCSGFCSSFSLVGNITYCPLVICLVAELSNRTTRCSIVSQCILTFKCTLYICLEVNKAT